MLRAVSRLCNPTATCLFPSMDLTRPEPKAFIRIDQSMVGQVGPTRPGLLPCNTLPRWLNSIGEDLCPRQRSTRREKFILPGLGATFRPISELTVVALGPRRRGLPVRRSSAY